MAETTAPIAPKSSGWKKTAGIVVITGLVAAGGGFWWSQSATARATPDGEVAPSEPVSRGLVKFDPFVVNLADGGGSHFLRATVQLVVEPSAGADATTADAILMVELRAAILELLAQQHAAALVTPDGKAATKTAIISRAQQALHAGKISDVLFSEFVVQF